LQWEYMSDANVHHFVILRADGEEPIRTLELVNANDITSEHRRKAIYRFADAEPKMNTAYRYAVRAVLSDERQSPISEQIQIQY